MLDYLTAAQIDAECIGSELGLAIGHWTQALLSKFQVHLAKPVEPEEFVAVLSSLINVDIMKKRDMVRVQMRSQKEYLYADFSRTTLLLKMLKRVDVASMQSLNHKTNYLPTQLNLLQTTRFLSRDQLCPFQVRVPFPFQLNKSSYLIPECNFWFSRSTNKANCLVFPKFRNFRHSCSHVL